MQHKPRQAFQAAQGCWTAHQYMAEIESKASVQLDASMPLAWKLTVLKTVLLKSSPSSEYLHYLPGRHLDLWKRPQASLSMGLGP